MESESGFRSWLRKLHTKLFGKHVVVYPTYGYPDPQAPDTWIVPFRVWVYDDRDTPFAEEAFEALARRYFEDDLQRPLEPAENARLEKTLEAFIADDKTNEEVVFQFEGDPHERVFAFAARTTQNGVIEENLRIPGELVADLYARHPGNRWLTVKARTTDGNGKGEGCVRFLEPEGLSVVSDIDDTIKVTHVPAGKKTVLRNTFLKEFVAAQGMRDRYLHLAAEAGSAADVCFHYVSGSPWQMFLPLTEFLQGQEGFPAGTFHMKALRMNLLETGALASISAFALGGDMATLEQKIRQITNLMIHLPKRRFILIGDSGEKDPEVFRAIRRLFPKQVEKIMIRDVLGERLAGMERITGDDVAVFLDTSDLEADMAELVAQATMIPKEKAPKL